jgi:hypothetical protein
LANGPVNLERLFLDGLGGPVGIGRPAFGMMDSAAARYDVTAFFNLGILLSP